MRATGKFAALLSLLSLLGSVSVTTARDPSLAKMNFKRTDNGLQDIVTWDKYSLSIRGERLMIFGGEIHPFRLPSSGLWIDVFQKVKALGYNAVSYYVHWGLYEGKPGEIRWDNFLDLDPFFDAAMKAGIWLIARPGPYINAETVGGGFPGWGTRLPELWRSSNKTYVDSFQNYWKAMTKKTAEHQITRGGPVILFQLENEYSGYLPPATEDFEYERILLEQTRDHGIVVPLTTNDVAPSGRFTSVDVYGYDSYPNGFDCTNPMVWQGDAVPEWFWGAHLEYSPNVPNAVYEMQGGAFDGWGGAGFEKCSLRLGSEFERVFYKNMLSISTTIYSIYMTGGFTSWGGIAHPGGYTSYDYGSALAEDRSLRPKYYEAKLIANFATTSPAYLTSRPQNIYASQGAYTGNERLKTTWTSDVEGKLTNFYTVRQVDISKDDTITYKLTVPTSIGNVTIPTLGGELSLIGKDSKIHLVDYVAGSTQLVYSSAEIFTSIKVDGKDVIVLYGAKGELHETAIKTTASAKVVSGAGKIKTQAAAEGVLAIQYTIDGQIVVDLGSALLYLVDRENAYQFWRVHLPGTGAYAAFDTKNPILVKGGYLIRGATTKAGVLALTGDLDKTSTLEIIAPGAVSKVVTFNGAPLATRKTSYGTLTATIPVTLPTVSLPNLGTLKWKAADSLPEIQPTYDDSKWVTANNTKTFNPAQPTTPVVLIAGDYGFHTGNLLWRAHFTASGGETAFSANVTGGTAFGFSAWIDSSFIGSWEGDSLNWIYEKELKFPAALTKGSKHIITILQDHMGYDQNWWAASEQFKAPRGILEYAFVGNAATTVTSWKVAGNLGGESYVDKARGPLNEGGLYAERQGWHLPGFDDSKWKTASPKSGIKAAGVSFFRTTFNLNVPDGLDYPISVDITNSTATSHYRTQIYVNGYQFGKYVNAIGPQTSFPVPEGILNYNGANTLAVSLWAHDAEGATIKDIALKFTKKVRSSKPKVKNMDLSGWKRRPGAF